jgi:hypothetical protein
VSIFWIWFGIITIACGISGYVYIIHGMRINMDKFVNTHILNNSTNLYITNKSIREMLLYIEVSSWIFIIVVLLLMLQIICKFHLKDKIRLNLPWLLGTKINSTLEYYLNKIISFNEKVSTIYIWLLILILIATLAYSVYISSELHTNLDNYVYTHNTIKDCGDVSNNIGE